MNAGIIGIAKYVPEKAVTNKDFEKILDTSDEWIRSYRDRESLFVAEGEETSD